MSAWRPTFIVFRKRSIATGNYICGPVMRRRNGNGKWEYRETTDAEQLEYIADEAW